MAPGGTDEFFGKGRSELMSPESVNFRQSIGPLEVTTTHVPAEFPCYLQRLAILCPNYSYILLKLGENLRVSKHLDNVSLSYPSVMMFVAFSFVWLATFSNGMLLQRSYLFLIFEMFLRVLLSLENRTGPAQHLSHNVYVFIFGSTLLRDIHLTSKLGTLKDIIL